MSNRTIGDIQREIHQVKDKMFKKYPNATYCSFARALNASEEVGELAREERLAIDGFGFNEEKAMDAVGDVFVSLIGYCIAREWNAQYLLEKTWEELKERWESKRYSGDPSLIVETCD